MESFIPRYCCHCYLCVCHLPSFAQGGLTSGMPSSRKPSSTTLPVRVGASPLGAHITLGFPLSEYSSFCGATGFAQIGSILGGDVGCLSSWNFHP